MFVWGVLKRGIPESVRFCIGDLPMYIFFIPTHPYFSVWIFVGNTVFEILVKNRQLLKLIIHGTETPLYDINKRYPSPYIPLYRSNTACAG